MNSEPNVLNLVILIIVLFYVALTPIYIVTRKTRFKGTQLDIRVINGDTIRAKYKGNRAIFKLSNIDAPKSHKPKCKAEAEAAARATARLNQLILQAEPKKIVIIDSGKHDQHDRCLVRMRIDRLDVGEILISEGLALPWKSGKEARKKRREYWRTNRAARP